MLHVRNVGLLDSTFTRVYRLYHENDPLTWSIVLVESCKVSKLWIFTLEVLEICRNEIFWFWQGLFLTPARRGKAELSAGNNVLRGSLLEVNKHKKARKFKSRNMHCLSICVFSFNLKKCKMAASTLWRNTMI